MDRIYLVQIYVDNRIAKTVAFSNKYPATQFAKYIDNDDGLQGIDRTEVIEAPIDNAAVNEFWDEIAAADPSRN